MSHNLHDASMDGFALADWRVLVLTGRDALAFAQSQFMNDVALLGDGQWQWNGWLTPKGRVIALFALLRFDAETLWLLLPDADAAEIAAKLQRYVFRSKIALSVRDDLHVSGCFATPAHANGAAFADVDGVIELDLGGDGGPRSLRIGPAPVPADDAAAAQWRRFDLQHGLPRLRGEQIEAWTPQQLSLDRLRAFSVKKGCYPGQEIVARTHYLGQVKRGLTLYQAASTVPAGADIEHDGRAIGSIACAQDGMALGVVTLEAASQSAAAVGIALVPTVLLDGLAR